MEKMEKEVPPIRIETSGNILIIEDDFDTSEILSMTLIREGYGVRCATSREEALNVFDKYLYDIVVLDYSMPGMSAEDFMPEVRRRSPRSKVILITAIQLVEERAKSLGIRYWVGKPFHPDVLLRAIKTASAAK